jgi:hypothetical protein
VSGRSRSARCFDVSRFFCANRQRIERTQTALDGRWSAEQKRPEPRTAKGLHFFGCDTVQVLVRRRSFPLPVSVTEKITSNSLCEQWCAMHHLPFCCALFRPKKVRRRPLVFFFS